MVGDDPRRDSWFWDSRCDFGHFKETIGAPGQGNSSETRFLIVEVAECEPEFQMLIRIASVKNAELDQPHVDDVAQ